MQSHSFYMAKALKLAKRGRLTVHPNPMVGCVLVSQENELALGWHMMAGQAHAEVVAIEDAQQKQIDLNNATAYVTLEPCAHQGRTGPCCKRLHEAGVARVVVAMQDPNPLVQGKGIEYLRQQGVEVIVGVSEQQARELNRGFIKRMEQGLPFVQVKMAASLDGRTAMANGQSQWITDEAAREDVQYLRAQAGAIITGSGTFYHDNPSLTVRASSWQYHQYSSQTVRQPLRVIVSSELPDARAQQSNIFTDGIPSLWFSGESAADTPASQPSHITFQSLPLVSNQVDLRAALRYLAELGVNSVLIESGAKLAASFIAQGLVDEIISYYAPKLMGASARPMFSLAFDRMSQSLDLQIKSVRQVGETVRIVAQLEK